MNKETTNVYEISSGNGPAECELAVTKLVNYLAKVYDAELVSASAGYNHGTYRSVVVASKTDLSEFVGSVLWVCKSPYRPNHKRKNWFINVKPKEQAAATEFDESKIQFKTCHSGGNGGQNVNKVETAVHAIYLPTGDATFCTEERSQHANKKKAVERLRRVVEQRNSEAAIKNANDMRISHVNLERGSAVATFEGEQFKRKRVK